MTGHDDFDRTLARWFEADAVSPAPADSLERFVVASRRSRPRPRWIAGLGSRWIREADFAGSRSGVGAIPRSGLRWSTALVLLLILAALLGAAITVGSRLLRPEPPATGQIGRLAYGLEGDIFVADWDGKNPVRIVDRLPVPDGPSQCGTIGGGGSMWSPDGRHLAYRSDHGGEACPGTVRVTDPEGNEIASFPGTGWLVSWSPDSTRVATWVDDSMPSLAIGIYALDGTREALLSVPNGLSLTGDYDALWSPDGRSVLMRLAPPSPSVVWELPIDGEAPRNLPDEDPRSHWTARYSPDGSQVAFIDDDDTLVVAAADGGGSRVLASGLVRSVFGAPLWSPKGDRIAFSWTDHPQDDSAVQELRVIDVASGTVTTLARGRGSEPSDGITFSPGGDRLLFSRAEALWSVNTDGSDARLLVSGTDWGDWQSQPAGS